MNIGGNNLELAKKLQEHLANKKGDKGAGISVAIVLNGELIAACTAGTRGLDGSPADIGDLYNVGSVTKVYCTAAIMKLVEMGKIDLDAPVIKYLPRFKMRDARYKEISVRMTLNHSSGLPGTNFRNAVADRWLGDNVMEENYEYWSHSKLKADPGTTSVYCNEGFELAAAIVEEVTDKTFIEFLRENIAIPIGALTTGEADVAIDDRKMMSCLGKSPEWVTAIGAGAIRTDLSDCARFGYIFIKPNGVIKKELLDETCKPHGATFLKNDDSSALFGLGWDTVEFQHSLIDLGEHVAGKGGATSQFSSYLLVSPKHKLSAAISLTSDCQMDTVELLCELIEIAMNEMEIEIASKIQSTAQQLSQAQPIPQDWLLKHGGVYYSRSGIYKPIIENDKLAILYYAGEGEWKPRFSEMQWDGEKFFGCKTFIFENHDGAEYIIQNNSPKAQRREKCLPMSEGWQKRLGKKYLACNVSAFDTRTLPTTAIKIDKVEDDGVILFATPNAPYGRTPAISYGDDDTEMFLNAPGFYASRDIYAPFMFKKDGIEYLRNRGYIFIDTDTVPVLKTGKISSPKKEQNAIFKIKSGTKLEFTKPSDVSILIFNEKLSMVYNSHDSNPMPEICDGYIIFANDGSMNFDIMVIEI